MYINCTVGMSFAPEIKYLVSCYLLITHQIPIAIETYSQTL